MGDHVAYWAPGARSSNPDRVGAAWPRSTTVSSSGDTNTSQVSCEVIVMRILLFSSQIVPGAKAALGPEYHCEGGAGYGQNVRVLLDALGHPRRSS